MPNQAPNPSFETDLTGWESASGTPSTLTRVTEQAWHGTWSMLVHSNAAANVTVRTDLAGSPAVVPGEVWSIGVHGRWKSGATPRNLRADLRWLNSGGTEAATQPSTGQSIAMPTSSWVQSKTEGVTAPADAATIRIRIVVVSTALDDEFYLDGIQIEKAATLPAFDTGGGFAAPTGLTATPVSPSQINLAWDAVTGASAYDIERDGVVVVFDHPTTSYPDTGLSPGVEYDYRVRAVE